MGFPVNMAECELQWVFHTMPTAYHTYRRHITDWPFQPFYFKHRIHSIKVTHLLCCQVV